MKDKILIEISNGCLTNVVSTNNDIEIFIIDHDICEDGYPPEVVEEMFVKSIDYHSDEISHEKFNEIFNSTLEELINKIEG